MSAAITSVHAVSTSTATAQPSAGAVNEAAAGETFLVTDPGTATQAANVIIPSATSSGTVNLGVATKGGMLSVTGEGTATLSIGGTTDAAGNALDQSGASIGISDNYAGSVIANFANAFISGDTKVNPDAVLGGADSSTGSVRANAPAGLDFTGDAAPNLYINTGKGADQIAGSDKNDFIRAGAGNDSVNAGAGDDIVSFGSGNDTATLGVGDDNLYLTVDQLGDGDVNTINDFDSDGDDKITFNKDMEGRLTITGQGTNTIIISLSGDTTATTTITSNGGTIDADDISFV